jgi:general secretion pathway protein D
VEVQNPISTITNANSEEKKSEAQKKEAEILKPEESKEKAKTVEKKEIENNDEAVIEFHFENADLEALIRQISDLYNITFITDDAITPLQAGVKPIKGNKISFKTQQPLTKREAWDLFNTFLQIAGFTIIDDPNPLLKRIVTLETAKKSPLPAFIGVPPSTLPDNDTIIRYVYFVENTSVDTLKVIVDSLRSTSSTFAILNEMKAFVLTDRSYNVKSLMNIVKELDKVSMPQAMSVLKLKRADAREVEKLYKELAQMDEKSLAAQRFFPARRPSSTHYFPENISIFAEPRTNSLILLGPEEAIKRIEDFIIKNVDIELTQPYSPLHVIKLRYSDAKTIAEIMNEVTRFGANSEAGKVGGVRGGDKYLKPIVFIPEPATNKLVVKGDYEDFLKAKEIVLKLDEPQPQVAIEVLLLAVNISNTKQLGAQLRSRVPGFQGLFGNDTVFQTSGLLSNGIVENSTGSGLNRLLGNLLELITNTAAGNTIISLGDSLNVWAIIQALEAVSNVQVLANPFLVATNKAKAGVALGETRRIITSQIIGTQTANTFGDASAKLTVKVEPQINSDGMIILDLDILLGQFIGAADPTGQNSARTERQIKTKTILTNNEVIALGGLVQERFEDVQTKVPILGDIPIIGWLFKNKKRILAKENLLILVAPRIIEPLADKVSTEYTQWHINDYTDTINAMHENTENRDPIQKWFFKSHTPGTERAADQFLFANQAASMTSKEAYKDIVIPNMSSNSKDDLKPKQSTKLADAITPSRKSRKSLVDLIEKDEQVRT